MNRISVRMLISQHISIFEPDLDQRNPNRVGIIDPKCKLKNVINEAFQNAAYLCEDYYDVAPEIVIKGQTMTKDENGKKTLLSVCYPPSHLYHIFFEVFKNSMRATIEKHRKSSGELPAIEVHVAKGKHDVSIQISDQGTGMSRDVIDHHLFQYLYSTAPRPS